MTIPHPHQLFDFSGQVAIITGSSSGLGSGIALRRSTFRCTQARSLSLIQRATAEIEKRLASYEPIQTDPKIDYELRLLMQSGVEKQLVFPYIPK